MTWVLCFLVLLGVHGLHDCELLGAVSALCAAESRAPGGGQDEAGDDGGDGAPHPEAAQSETAVEGEQVGERAADGPVDGGVGDQRGSGVAEADQSAAEENVGGIAELREAADEEDGSGRGDDGGVVGVDACPDAREADKEEGGDSDEAEAKDEAGVGGAAHGDEAAGAGALADAGGGDVGEAERDHEDEGIEIEDDLMRGEHGGAEAGADDGHVGGKAEIGELLDGGGPADAGEETETGEVRLERSEGEAQTVAFVRQHDAEEEKGDHVDADDAGGPAGAGDPE